MVAVHLIPFQEQTALDVADLSVTHILEDHIKKQNAKIAEANAGKMLNVLPLPPKKK